ncbi:MAG: HprK-related kinase A [Gammaproteobacteria bacterium]|nr:HprK-related kinase A [Gammaproteobacteria bacterium]
MILSSLSKKEFAGHLRNEGLPLRTGPFVTCIRSPIRSVADGIGRFYADYEVEAPSGFSDFHVRVAPPRGLRRWVRPQVRFAFDGRHPFTPLPLAHAYAILEWGMNWCVSAHSNRYLIIHAAAVAKDERAFILPAPPGSGKSTLCAGLVSRGWRLLSDEMALVATDSGALVPIPRPISLKNESIDVMKRFAPGADIGHLAHDTIKGTVGHMKAPLDSVRRSNEKATPLFVIFPKFERDAPATLSPHSKGRAFMELAKNAFNYSILGKLGFNLLGDVIDQCGCYDFRYGNLEEAITIFNELARDATDSRDIA